MDLNSLKNLASQAGLGQQPPAGPAGAPAHKSPKKLVVVIVAAVLGISILGAVGNFIMGKVVNFGARKAFEAGTGIKVSEKGDRVSFTGQNGEQVQFSGDTGSGTMTVKNDKGEVTKIDTQSGEGAKTLPKEFPSDFPLFPGAALTSTWSMAVAGQGQSFILAWSTDTSPEDVAAYFEKELTAQGWEKSLFSASGNMTVLQFQRAAGPAEVKDTASFSLEKKDAATEFSLTLMLARR